MRGVCLIAVRAMALWLQGNYIKGVRYRNLGQTFEHLLVPAHQYRYLLRPETQKMGHDPQRINKTAQSLRQALQIYPKSEGYSLVVRSWFFEHQLGYLFHLTLKCSPRRSALHHLVYFPFRKISFDVSLNSFPLLNVSSWILTFGRLTLVFAMR